MKKNQQNQQKTNKIAFINNTDKSTDFDFEYTQLVGTGLNVDNINKSDIINDYDFVLILEESNNEQQS